MEEVWGVGGLDAVLTGAPMGVTWLEHCTVACACAGAVWREGASAGCARHRQLVGCKM